MAGDNLVLICGASKGGKTTSLRNIENHDGVVYLNCESGKKPQFKNNFRHFTITDPYTIYTIFDEAEKSDKIHTIIIDSQTYLMDMFYSMYIANAVDTQKGWNLYGEYFRVLMLNYVAKSTKNIFFTAHTLSIFNENESIIETKVPIKGALKGCGVESYFSIVIAAKKVSITTLEKYKNDMLTITEEEEAIGVKHVFQTRLTKETVHERISSPIDMFSINETYIDNDISLVLKRIKQYNNN